MSFDNRDSPNTYQMRCPPSSFFPEAYVTANSTPTFKGTTGDEKLSISPHKLHKPPDSRFALVRVQALGTALCPVHAVVSPNIAMAEEGIPSLGYG
ncbi:unnamed protein product [Fusarium graminearum]|nr:unnamed protein product [Fusarium graminearum]